MPPPSSSMIQAKVHLGSLQVELGNFRSRMSEYLPFEAESRLGTCATTDHDHSQMCLFT